MKKIWRKNGRIIVESDTLTTCESCPCGSGCCPWANDMDLVIEFCPCYPLYLLVVEYIVNRDLLATNNLYEAPNDPVPHLRNRWPVLPRALHTEIACL